jgi:hypothetical protein
MVVTAGKLGLRAAMQGDAEGRFGYAAATVWRMEEQAAR